MVSALVSHNRITGSIPVFQNDLTHELFSSAEANRRGNTGFWPLQLTIPASMAACRRWIELCSAVLRPVMRAMGQPLGEVGLELPHRHPLCDYISHGYCCFCDCMRGLETAALLMRFH